MNRIKELSPCYIYEEDVIKSACNELADNLKGFSFLYSIKSNPFMPVVETVAKCGFGADAASIQEVIKSSEAGMSKEMIYYSAPGKRKEELKEAIGKCTIIVDSLNEIVSINEIAKEANTVENIGLRVNPTFGMGTNASSSKFGIDLEDEESLYNTLKQCQNVKPVGIHIHLRSQVLDAHMIGEYYKSIFDLALYLKDRLEMDMEFINFGSGIGIVYDKSKDKEFDLNILRQETDQLVVKNSETLNAKLLIETGRFVVCKAGSLYLPVLDKKVSHGITYLIVPNGLNGFLRPGIANLLKKVASPDLAGMEPLFTSYNAFEVSVLNDSNEKEVVNVVGNLCTALDVIAEGLETNKAEIGDIIKISNAGSYAYSLSPLLFSSHPLPKQYLYTSEEKYIEG